MPMPEQSAPQAAAAPQDTVIQRKAQAGLAEHQARAMSLSKALRMTIAKVADTLFDMSMGVIAVRREVRAGDRIAEPLKQEGLRMIFDGPNRARAAIILDGDMVASLIQQQTMGKVLEDVGNGPRQLTATDAAICAPFLETVLAQASRMPEKLEEQQIIAGYRFGFWAEDARILGMALDAADYDLIHIDLDIAGGVRQGHILLCMPQSEPEHVAPVPSTDDATALEKPRRAVPRMAETAMNLEAEVRISLAQVRMSLRRLGELKTNSIIDLGVVPFDRVGVQTIEGKTVARGVLGQLSGQRAVQVSLPGQAAASGAAFSAGGMARVPALEAPLQEDDILSGFDNGEEPQITELSDLPDMSDLPDLPDMSDLPDLPDMGALDGLADLPDLPDLSD